MFYIISIHLVSCYHDHSFYFFHIQRKKNKKLCDIQLFNYTVKKNLLEKKYLVVTFAIATNHAQFIAMSNLICSLKL